MSQDALGHYKLGVDHLMSGDLDQAVKYYRKTLEVDPQFIAAINDLGFVSSQRGDEAGAIALYTQALQIKPDFAPSLLNLAGILKMQGKLDEAISLLRRTLEIDPRYVKALNNLAIIYQEQNRFEESIGCLNQAINLDPNFSDAHFNLGISLNACRRFDEAHEAYRRAIEINPNYPEACLNLGAVVDAIAFSTGQMSKLDDAVPYYLRALELRPGYPDAHFNLGLNRLVKRDMRDAAVHFRKAAEADPNSTKALLFLGRAHRELNELEESTSAYRQAVEIRAARMECSDVAKNIALLLLELESLPVIYKDVEHVNESRKHYDACLKEATSLLSNSERSFTSEEQRLLRDVLFQVSNFYLAYQQFNDKDLQRRYSELATAILSEEFEGFLDPLTSRYDKKIRIGIASSNLGNHNGSFWAYHWLLGLSPETYEFFLYSLNGLTDEFTQKFAELGTYRWLPFLENSYQKSLQIIRDDHLDVLLLPDVGMTVPSRIISLTRLAPVQCVGWGHPETTGSANIDYYLSSDLMESAEADSHYSEQLVRLPNIGIYMEEPAPPSEVLTAADFNIPHDRILYGSVQSLFKSLPQFDFVFPAIAKEVPNAFFVFVGSECDSVTDAFRERLKSEFEAAGICFDDYVKVLPRLPYIRFMQLLDVLDINLDTFGWNGGITTINSLAMNCPVVTLPGEFMRGRHSYAILKMIGVEELITRSIEEYISLSVKIGLDAEFRSSIVQKIKDQKHKVFNDKECVEYLDEFLRSKVAEVRANSTIEEEVKTIELAHATGTAPFYFRGSSSDEIVLQQIFVDHDYSLSDLQLSSQLDEFLSANTGRGLRPLILDLGANIGASAVWFLHNYPSSRVIAVEPDGGNFELLTRNTQGLDCIAIKGAIASEKGFANIEDPGLCHFGLRTTLSPSGSVETFTVPELMQRYGGNSWFPFIAKIDIEGAESELFSKNTDWIDQFPVVIIELHDWLLPSENTSRNFLHCVSSRARDFLYKRENIFSVRTPVHTNPADNLIYQPAAPLVVQ